MLSVLAMAVCAALTSVNSGAANVPPSDASAVVRDGSAIVRSDSAVIQPDVRLALEADDDGVIPVWLFFTDKGFTSDDEQQAAIERVAASYPARAVQRRQLRRTLPGLFDEHDLPVAARYVEAVRATGASVRIESRWLNAVSASATPAQIESIAALPFVSKIQPLARTADFRPRDVKPIPHDEGGNTITDFYGYASGQLSQIGITLAHGAGYTGGGMIIGVLDTGFQRSHEAYNEPGHSIVVLGEYDWVSGDGNTQKQNGDHEWQHWHGTAILSEIAAYKPDVFVGGAYDASFYLAKTEDVTQEIPLEEDHYVAGLEWFEMNGVDVSTSSLGYIDWYTQQDLDGQTAVTSIGVNIATGNGMACCTAAGNSGHDFDPNVSHLIAPADAFQVFTVGAVNVYGETAGFSSDGPTADGRVKPEVLACGDATYIINPDDDHGYGSASGTSCSTPLVASAVTLLVQAHPDWSVAQLRSALLQSGTIFQNTGTFDPYVIEGYGIINVWTAIQRSFIGDIDRDGDTDLADHAAFADCMSGPGVPVAQGCERSDLDGDNDADLADAAVLQNNFSGAW